MRQEELIEIRNLMEVAPQRFPLPVRPRWPQLLFRASAPRLPPVFRARREQVFCGSVIPVQQAKGCGHSKLFPSPASSSKLLFPLCRLDATNFSDLRLATGRYMSPTLMEAYIVMGTRLGDLPPYSILVSVSASSVSTSSVFAAVGTDILNCGNG
jgi:hypothetical protein